MLDPRSGQIRSDQVGSECYQITCVTRQGAHPPKDGVLVVKPGGGHSGDEELAAIGAGPAVGHGQGEGAIMPQGPGELVTKFRAPDARTTSAVTCHSLTVDPGVCQC